MSSPAMLISGLVKSSLVDFPGLVACVLFTPGCNYNCFYCHNRALINGNLERIDPLSLQVFLEKRAGLLDGVVITGGEPTLQSALPAYIEAIRKMGFKVKLDTNGSSPHVVRQLLQNNSCDYYAVDFKAPPLRYREICGPGANPSTVLKTIDLLLQFAVDFEVRTTVIPQFNESDLVCIAQTLPVVPRFCLNRYRKPSEYLPRDEDRINQSPHSQTRIDQFAEIIRSYQPHTTS